MGSCFTEGLSATATTKNQLTGNGMLYDAAGNVTNDGVGNTPTYDQENRISTDAGYTYSYDADGTRMEKSTGSSGTMYWPGPSGTLTETDLTGTINEEYIYFNGQRIARVDRPSGTVHYYFSNHLGSHTMVTSAAGVCEQDIDYYPYGGVVTDHCPTVAQHYKFTGKERDSESGLDNFGARYYASTMGRFMIPDPIFMELHRLEDPQQLNLYSYVRNNPESLTDPSGELIDIDCSKVSSAQCSQTVSDLNSRKDAQFQVTRDDKTGQLNVDGKVDTSKLSKSEAELYKAVTDTSATGTLQVVPFSASVMGDQFAGKGLNIVDRADLNQFGKANSSLPGEILAHAGVEAFESQAQNLDYTGAHNFANKFFGDISVGNLFTLPRGAATATSGQATYNFQRVGVSVNVQKIFVVPQPAGSVNQNWERINGNIVVSTSDKK